jgi:hypothetical protein
MSRKCNGRRKPYRLTTGEPVEISVKLKALEDGIEPAIKAYRENRTSDVLVKSVRTLARIRPRHGHIDSLAHA